MDWKTLVFFSLIVLLLPVIAWAGVVSDTANITITEDDCKGVDLPTFDSTATYYYLANSLNPNYTGAVRFLDMGIAQGTTVDSASLKFSSWETCYLTDGGCRTIIYGDDSDNSAVFNSAANPVDRAKTTAFKEDSSQTSDTPNGESFWTFDVKDIVQEIVSREGFASEALSFLIEDNGSYAPAKQNVNAVWYTIDYGTKTVARLIVWWTEEAPAGNPLLHRKKRMGGIFEAENYHNSVCACPNRGQ